MQAMLLRQPTSIGDFDKTLRDCFLALSLKERIQSAANWVNTH